MAELDFGLGEEFIGVPEEKVQLEPLELKAKISALGLVKIEFNREV